MKNKKQIDMINGNIVSNMIAFAFPIMISDLLHMFYTAADTIVVGKFAGEIPLAAVGATSSLTYMFIALFEGLSLGANVVVAKAIGENNKEKIKRAVHTSAMICLVGGVLITSLATIFSRRALELMATPSSIIDYSALYMRIYFSGIIFTLVFNFGSAVLRANGETKKPMYFQMLSGILNVILNLFFVVALKMTVEGVAIATVISQAVAATLTVITLTNSQDDIQLCFKDIAYHSKETLEIIKVGVPAGIQGMAFSLTNLVVQSSLNSFDSSIIIAGNTAANNIENFVYIGVMGFETAVLTFSSQCIGAKRYDRLKKIFRTGIVLVVVSMSAIGLTINLLNTPLLSLYTDSVQVIEAGKVRLFYVTGFLWLNGIIDVESSTFRAMGYSALSAALLLGGIIGVRLIWLLTIFPLHRTLQYLYLCFPISWIITALVNGTGVMVVYNKLIKQNN